MKLSRVVLIAAVLGALALGAASVWRGSAATGRVIATQVRPGDIRMLGSETCVVCAVARVWFKANQVPYRECVIERDPACRREFEAGGWSGTPVILVRGLPLLGFSPQQVQDALAAPG